MGHPMVAVWLSGNALISVNEVVVRRARLVLEWVTVSARYEVNSDWPSLRG